MVQNMKIVYLPLTKANWTNPELESMREKSRKFLSSLPGVTLIGGDKMIETEEQAMSILEECKTSQPDLVIGHFLSFALGVVLPRFALTLKVPTVLWSIPEPEPAGGRLRANSFCAVNMNTHTLWKLHCPSFPVHGNIGEADTAEQLKKVIRIVRVLQKLRTLKIGSVGGRVPGFFTSTCNEMLLRNRIGCEVVPLTMLEITSLAERLPENEVNEAEKVIFEDALLHETDAPEKEDMRKSASLYASVRKTAENYMLDAITLRCWPEVISDEMYGITLCSTIGHLTNHGLLTVCEGDVYAAVLQAAMQEFSELPPYFCDLIKLDEDPGVAWHCGAAPCALCRKGHTPRLRRSSTVGGGGIKGCVCEFPLKPGRVTVARLGENREGNDFRMLLFTGTAVETDLFVRGNPLKIQFDVGSKALSDELLHNGWEHHFSIVYGDATEEILALCRALDIPVTHLK